ncbi:hypothetical protein GF314_01800 [bacterium]|nr:hypothetical protein [bacterium]
MNRWLLRHHPLLRPMYVKWLMMAVATATMWLGAVILRLTREDAGLASWPLLASIWIVPAVYLAFGGANQRVRSFPLTLPLPVGRLWRTHLLAVLLTSGGVMLASLGILHLALRGVADNATRSVELIESTAGLMPAVWLHALAWWLLLLAVLTSHRPQLAELPRDRRWLLRTTLSVAGCLAGLLWLAPLGGPALALVVLAAATGLLVHTWRRLPPSLALAPRDRTAAATRSSLAPATARPPRWRRRPLWLTVLMTTSKHPVPYVIGLPFAVLMGLAISSGGSLIADGVNTGNLFVSIVAYGIFAMVAAPLVRLSIFDHLPLSRGRLLASVLGPTVLLVLVGFLAGEALAPNRDNDREAPLEFSSDPEHYGVRLGMAHRPVAWGEAPARMGPDGELEVPPVAWSPFGGLGPTIYRPFSTPAGSSLDACARQLERASAHVFDRAIPARDFRERYLTVDEQGLVVLREDGMDLLADYPDRQPRAFPGLPPLNLTISLVLFFVAYSVYITRFRPGRGDGQRKASFVTTLVLLMSLYLLPFLLDMSGHGDAGVVVTLAHALSAWLVATLPGGAASLWLLTAATLVAGWLLILHGFRRAEWPPVREDDAVFDVLG